MNDPILLRLGLTQKQVRESAVRTNLKQFGLDAATVAKFVVKVEKPLPRDYNVTRVTGGKRKAGR